MPYGARRRAKSPRKSPILDQLESALVCGAAKSVDGALAGQLPRFTAQTDIQGGEAIGPRSLPNRPAQLAV